MVTGVDNCNSPAKGAKGVMVSDIASYIDIGAGLLSPLQ
jgi:hypothetical protein